MDDNKINGGEMSLDDILNEYSDAAADGARGKAAETPPNRKPPSRRPRPDIDFGAERPSAAERIRKLSESMAAKGEKPQTEVRRSPLAEDNETAPASQIAQVTDDTKIADSADDAAQKIVDSIISGIERTEIGEENSAGESRSDRPESEPAADRRRALSEYLPDPRSRGARFTMRTDDDRDVKKIPTAQSEYTERGEEDLVMGQIRRLKNSLTFRAAALLFASLFSLFITIANDLKLPMAAVFDRTVNPAAFIFSNTILGIVAVGISYSAVMQGIKNLFKGRPDSDSAAALAIMVSVLSGLVTLFDPEPMKSELFHLYTSAALLSLFFNTVGKLTVVYRAERNFEFVSANEGLSAVVPINDPNAAAYITNGGAGGSRELAAMRKTDFPRDFMKNSYSSDLADLYAEKTTLPVLLLAAAVGVLSLFFEKNAEGALQKVFVFLAAMSGTVSLTTCFGLALTANLPLSNASKKLLGQSGVMLGYSSVEEFGEVNSVICSADDLFPNGSVEFTNLKVLGSYTIDKAIVYAASLAEAGGSVTRPAFYKMVRGETDILLPVTRVSEEEGLGICGSIKGERVMFGTRGQMNSHGVEGLPPESSEARFAGGKIVLYLAVSGHAMMMFAVGLSVSRGAARCVRHMCGDKVTLYVRTHDGFITRKLISNVYNTDPSRINILAKDFDSEIAEMTAPAESLSASMLCTGRLSTLAAMISAAKQVKADANMGVAVQYSAMLLGAVISVVMMLTGHFSQISATAAMIYELAFTLIMLAMQKFRRY